MIKKYYIYHIKKKEKYINYKNLLPKYINNSNYLLSIIKYFINLLFWKVIPNIYF